MATGVVSAVAGVALGGTLSAGAGADVGAASSVGRLVGMDDVVPSVDAGTGLCCSGSADRLLARGRGEASHDSAISASV
jgi:hypothetical protein